MSLVEEMHTARKARLARLGAIQPQRDELIEAIKSIDPVKEPEPAPQPVDAVSEWIDRQKAIPLPVPSKQACYPTIDGIQRAVGAHFNVSKIDLMSARRTKDLIIPRHIACYLCRTMTLRSLPDIGRKFGDRDHSSILHAVRKIERLLQTDQALSADVEAIQATIEAGL